LSTRTLDSTVATSADGSHTGLPRPGLGEAMSRHWAIVLVSVVVFMAAAAALGVRRHPEYTAHARVAVGHVFVDNPAAVPGVLEASQMLASNDARAIEATAVLRRTRRLADTSEGSLSATPTPSSPLIKITAKAGSARAAVRLANAASIALADYVNGQNRTNESARVTFARFHHAALDYQRKLDTEKHLQTAYNLTPTRAARAARDAASAATQAALLRRNTLSTSYQSLTQAGSSSPKVEPFARAVDATSDRRSTLEILLFVGLVAGFAVGAALAMFRAGSRARRTAAAR
jgi:hypothetical protein